MRTWVHRFLILLAVGATVTAFPSRASPIAYVVEGTGQFGSMDLASGVFTPIGAPTVSWLGIAKDAGGVFYGADATNHYRINPATGAATTIGPLGVSGTGKAFAGLSDGSLYFMNTANTLYSVDPLTGSAMLVGSTGIAGTAVGNAMAGDATQLYYVLNADSGPTQNNATLFTVNPVTAAAHQVGTGTGHVAIGGAGYIGTTLYGFDNPNKQLLTIDTSSGVASTVTAYSASASFIFGAAATPEPACAGLLLLAAAGFVARRR